MKTNAVSVQTADPKSIAEECLQAADGDRAKARDLLARRFTRDPELKLAALSMYTDAVINWLISQASHDGPKAVKRGAEPSTAGLTRLAIANTRDLLGDYRLSDGLALGNATREQIKEEANGRKAAAADHLVHYTFLAKLATRLPDGVRVASRFDNQQLLALFNEANAEVRS